MRTIISALFILCFSFSAQSQAPKRYTSGDIYAGIEKLNFLGSALYLAAHPDDENTRLIAYLANEVKAHTTYLSLTRGDGGQNLIGTEIQEMLGVLRTQELLAARRTDGGNQTFSRANDFGYSKHPDETFKIWGKDEVLSDVVWAIRKYRPDIIVNRFDHRTPGRTHGHHTASAMLSVEASDLSGRKDIYPSQLAHVEPWEPNRVFFNTSWWFYGSREKFEEADKSRMTSVDVGVYYPLIGKSNTEIAAESRSMHKCQGFGSTGTRGSSSEYLELIKGDVPKNKEDLFEGINTTWTRVKNGGPIGQEINQVLKSYEHTKPALSVPALLNVRKKIAQLDNGFWKETKLAEVDRLITMCMGFFSEITAEDATAVPGEKVNLTVEHTNRSKVGILLKSISISDLKDSTLSVNLPFNETNKIEVSVELPSTIKLTSPYWLNKDGRLGMYAVKEQTQRGKPESNSGLTAHLTYDIAGHEIEMTRPVVYKRNDNVKGEVYSPFEIVPPVSVSISDEVYIFPNNGAQEIEVTVKSFQDNIAGTIELCHDEAWEVSPKNIAVDIANKGDQRSFKFSLSPKGGQGVAQIVPLFKFQGMEGGYTDKVTPIEYDHIPKQTIVQDASSKVVRINIKKAGQRVAYVMGAGDKIPESLQQIGYDVDLVDVSEISKERLDNYDACIMGIRAYNTKTDLKFKQQELLDYVEGGGTLIIQYNTSRRMSMDNLGPYPLKLSRDRVTVEEAEVRLLKPDHPILNTPNKITKEDFDGWIQERGLYFPNEWDDRYDAILSSNDPGEDPKDGSLLVTKFGKGYYIYTGLSMFRELPAGVPGAYRLFANMISIGKNINP